MIYILHFDEPYYHARHYVGFCEEGNLDQRLSQHRGGQGSPLMLAVESAGIRWSVALTAPGGRDFERTIKRAKKTSRYCPLCIATGSVSNLDGVKAPTHRSNVVAAFRAMTVPVPARLNPSRPSAR